MAEEAAPPPPPAAPPPATAGLLFFCSKQNKIGQLTIKIVPLKELKI